MLFRSREIKLTYTESFKLFKNLEQKLNQLYVESEKKNKESDYNTFLLNELVDANLVVGEQEGLEEELKLLENAEDIKLKLTQITNEISEGDTSMNDRMGDLTKVLGGISEFSKELESLNERFVSVHEEMKDIAAELDGVQQSVDYNPERLAEVNERIGLLFQLQQKHKVTSVDELIEIQRGLETSALGHENLEDQIIQIKDEFEKGKKSLIIQAEKLSECRRGVLDDFSDKINQLLRYVGIPEGYIELAYKRIEPTKTGIDEVELLFSANKGVKPEPVKQVASGGEFSRLMFCVKYLLADKTAMPTIIFDEIDTGVSGEIGIKMANMMKKMSKNHQLIAISHLPQVAAKGDAHYFVYKNSESQTSESLIKKLENDERIDSIAKMIGGDNPSQAAIQSAKEMIAL